MSDLQKKITNLNKKMIKEFGNPQNKTGIPTLEWMIKAWLFYNENKPTIYNVNDKLNMDFLMCIEEMKEKIVESANIGYSVSETKFFEFVQQYQLNKSPITNPPLNSHENMIKRKELFSILKQRSQKINTKTTMLNSCHICGDTSNEIELVFILNSNQENKYICVDCIKCQEKLGNKFTANIGGYCSIIS